MNAAAVTLATVVYVAISIAVAMFMFPLFPRELDPDDGVDQTLVMALAILWPVAVAGFVLALVLDLGWRAVRWPFKQLARIGFMIVDWRKQPKERNHNHE